MFQKIGHTDYPPAKKPVLVWDGNCGFCAFWVTHWKKITRGTVDFKPFQDVADQFQDIPLAAFKSASHFITTTGTVHSGPDSAYMSYLMANPSSVWHAWYIKYDWFNSLSDRLYGYIARNRSFMFRVTKIMFGSNPKALKPYWLLYLLAIVIGGYLFFDFL